MFPAYIKKILLVFIGVVLVLGIIPSTSFASTSLNTNPDVPNTLHNRTQVVLIELSSALMCQLIGVDVINPTQNCLGIDRTTNKIGFVKSEYGAPLKGAVMGMTNLIAKTYNIPVNTNDYVKYVASGFSIIKPAYAQTTGFDNLSALISLWKKVRDLTYLGFVLMFVLIGLGVMLRVKLDPRTVMTIQNQIPKAVVYLLLITFSYAIAGLLVDGMWVATFTGVNIITDGITCTDGVTLTQKGTVNLLDNPIHYVNRTLGCPFDAGGAEVNRSTVFRLGQVVGNTLGEIVSTTILSVFGDFNNMRCAWTDSSTYGNCIKLGFQEVVSWIIGFIMMLAIIVAVFVQLIRVWINLLKAYLQIILYTILGPIWILAGIIPNNQNFGFMVWVRKMLASLAIFPITIYLFLVAVVLASDQSIQSPDIGAGQVFLPPMVGNPNIADNMGFLLALGVILITPQVVEMTREMFKTSPSKYAPAAMAAIGAGMGSAMAPVKKTWGALNARDQSGGAKGPAAFIQDKINSNASKWAVDKLGRFERIGKIARQSHANRFRNSPWTIEGITHQEALHRSELEEAARQDRIANIRNQGNTPNPPTASPVTATDVSEQAAATEATQGSSIAPPEQSTPATDLTADTED